jgi:hypothetical protein
MGVKCFMLHETGRFPCRVNGPAETPEERRQRVADFIAYRNVVAPLDPVEDAEYWSRRYVCRLSIVTSFGTYTVGGYYVQNGVRIRRRHKAGHVDNRAAACVGR